MSLENSSKKLFVDYKYDATELEHEENETENSIDDQGNDTREMKEIPEITSEELQTAINRLKKKKENQQTAMESELKTSKLAMKRRKDGETDLQRGNKSKRIYT